MTFEKKKRDWVLSFGPLSGKAGERKTAEVSPEVQFDGELFVLSGPAFVRKIWIGGKPQAVFATERAAQPGTYNVMGCLDTCAKGDKVKLEIEFRRSGDWDGSLLGKSQF